MPRTRFPSLKQTAALLPEFLQQRIGMALGDQAVACGERTRTVIALQSPRRIG